MDFCCFWFCATECGSATECGEGAGGGDGGHGGGGEGGGGDEGGRGGLVRTEGDKKVSSEGFGRQMDSTLGHKPRAELQPQDC